VNLLDLIKARRSIREYAADDISDAQIESLLEAAMAAPSASNRQPWEFIVVRDPELRGALSEVHSWGRMAASAPVVIAVCGRTDVSRHWVEDCAAATANLLLAATALNLGAAWVAIHPDPDRHAAVRGILRIPDSVQTLCLIPLGYPADTKAPHTKYDPKKVHRNLFTDGAGERSDA
jgi:nitroreductase